MFFEMQNIKDVVSVTRILIWIGVIIIALCLVFELLIVGKSHIGSILNQKANSIYIGFGYILFCIFWIVDIKPFKSIWRFLLALIPFLLLLSPFIMVIYAIWDMSNRAS